MKIYVTLLAALFTALPLLAQDAEIRGMGPKTSSSPERFVRRIMPQASVVFSQVQGADAGDYYGRNGFTAGALVDLGGGDLVVETGALYREMGLIRQSGGPALNVQYLSFPVAAKYYFFGQESTSPYVKGGAMGSTLLSQNANNSPGYTGTQFNVAARSWELSALAGVGGKFYLSPGADALVEMSYIRAIDSLTPDASIYSASVNLTAGIAISL